MFFDHRDIDPLAEEQADGRTFDLGPVAIEAMVGHRNFNAAIHQALTAAVDLYRGNWILGRLASDRGRFLIGLIFLDLDHVSRGAGVTVSQLRKEASAYQIASPGRIAALVASLRLLGLLKLAPTADRRERRLLPTEKLVALHRLRWQASSGQSP